jgi:hypothetical protein
MIRVNTHSPYIFYQNYEESQVIEEKNQRKPKAQFRADENPIEIGSKNFNGRRDFNAPGT